MSDNENKSTKKVANFYLYENYHAYLYLYNIWIKKQQKDNFSNKVVWEKSLKNFI